MKPRQPIPRISQRKAESDNVYNAVKRRWWKLICSIQKVLSNGDPFCQVKGCHHYAEHNPHHIIPKSLRKDLEADEKNFLAVCWRCHRYIHDHPAWAYSHGYLGKSTDDLNELAERRAR